MRLREMQARHAEWLAHNFPGQDPIDPLLGLIEEVGELAHAVLKRKQAIRTGEDHDAAEEDAMADILIYLLSYANANGKDLEEIAGRVLAEVHERDWVARPVTG